MRALVVYESMFGNTRAVARAVADGLTAAGAVAAARPVGEVQAADLVGLDLLVLGAPTHSWSLSRPTSRAQAARSAEESNGRLQLEPQATGIGLREWLADAVAAIGAGTVVVCFDTRVSVPMGMSGSAANAAARQLRRADHRPQGAPMGFLVTKLDTLVEGELGRARDWGHLLADSLVTA